MEHSNGRQRGRVWKFGPCEYNELKRELWVLTKKVTLRDKPLCVLVALLRAPGHIQTKEQIINTCWPDADDTANEEGSLTTAIRMIRDVLPGPDREAVIRTIHKVGYEIAVPVQYRFIEEVTEPEVKLVAGAYVPGKKDWKLIRPLDQFEPHWVWLAEHQTTRQIHVFKFAEDGVRLQALQKELTLFRYFEKLAQDSHCFVKLFDWRLTTKPYFLEAEYGGLNLVEWAQTQRESGGLSREVCLEVIADLAEAIDTAHEHGVIHNDLKPSNILISPGPALPGASGKKSWRVKVCDFGIASLFDLDRLADLDITSHGFAAPGAPVPDGSLLYRAPEVRPDHPPTVSADIYALGVILFQLLCGDFRQTPVAGWQERIDDPILREDIEETVNLNPALRLKRAADLADRIRTLESRRKTSVERDRMRQEADLALRRYQVIQARRPWFWAAIVALAAGLCASLWFYYRARHEESVTTQVNEFLAHDLIAQADPKKGNGADETLRDGILKAEPKIDQRFDNAPEVAARLHDVIARSLDNMQATEDASAEYVAAAAAWIRAEGPQSQNALFDQYQRVFSLGRSHDPGTVGRATKILAQQEQVFARISNPAPRVVWARMNAQGILTAQSGDVRAAVGEFQKAADYAMREPSLGSDIRISAHQRLCAIEGGAGDYNASEDCSRKLIDQITAIEGPESGSLNIVRVNLLQALMLQGKFQEALQESVSLYPTLAKANGPDNHDTLLVLGVKASSEASLGRWDAAVPDFAAIHEAAKRHDPKSFQTTGSLGDLSLAECRAGRRSDGESHAREALAQALAEGAIAGLTGSIRFDLASCLLITQNAKSPSEDELREAEEMINKIDVKAVSAQVSSPDWGFNLDLARAQLAFYRHQLPKAAEYLAAARPAFGDPNSEPYQHKLFEHLDSATKSAATPGSRPGPLPAKAP